MEPNKLAQNVVARFRKASIPPTVEGFLMYLSGAVTQFDQRASKRRGYNPYALGHYLKAVGDIRKDVASAKESSDPGALQKLAKSISRHFSRDFPPAKKTVKAIEDFIRTGKAPMYPGVRGAADDLWLDREDIAKLCPSCAEKMASLGIRKVRASVIFNDEKIMAALLPPRTAADPWKSLPKGWTEDSVKKFWGSLTGKVQHKVTKCIDKMKGSGVSDPGAFCASLADKIEGKDWRSREAAWESLPHGWTQESLKNYWDSFVGEVKHKVTKCIKDLEGNPAIDDPGAFCASLADKMEPGWRS